MTQYREYRGNPRYATELKLLPIKENRARYFDHLQCRGKVKAAIAIFELRNVGFWNKQINRPHCGSYNDGDSSQSKGAYKLISGQRVPPYLVVLKGSRGRDIGSRDSQLI